MNSATGDRVGKLTSHLFFILLSIAFIVPLWAIVAISLSGETDLVKFGYRLIPKSINFEAYRYILQNPKTIVSAYKVTIIISAVGTVLSILMISMCAYALSRRDFAYRRVIALLLFFTTLFSGGLVPYYILMTQYMHVQNTYPALIIPLLGNVWHMLLIRSFFQQLPDSLMESATIDGAGELTIYFRIVIPLSTPVLATVSLMTLLSFWNSWYPALLFISNNNMYPLQYLLQVMLSNAEEIMKDISDGMFVQAPPTESARMAMCMLAIAPMLFVFPFFQKYFAKGLTVGSVKG